MSLRPTRMRSIARLSAFPLAVLGLSSLAVGPALAHVSISPDSAAAGDYTVATVSVPHGCDGSPTTTVTIKIPDQVLSVTPTRNPLWKVKKTMATLDEPVKDAHGNEITEKVDTVVYTALAPLPDGYRDAFELSFQVPDVAGTTLLFPTIQRCIKGQTDWVEATAEGGEEPEHPAPLLAVVAASDGDGHGAVSAAEPSASDESGEDSGAPSGVAYGGLAAGVLALGLGGAAFAKSRKA